EYARIEAGPGRTEQRLFREGVLGIQEQQLGPRFVSLEVVRDEAGALIRAWRAAIRIVWSANDHQATVLHGLELTPQQEGLRTSVPGVREPLAGYNVVPLQCPPLHLDAWREDESVIPQGTPVVECDLASHRV